MSTGKNLFTLLQNVTLEAVVESLHAMPGEFGEHFRSQFCVHWKIAAEHYLRESENLDPALAAQLQAELEKRELLAGQLDNQENDDET